MNPGPAVLLRMYLNAEDSAGGMPLYRAAVETARRRGLAGASVFPVEMGFGVHRHIHDLASEYSSSIPIVVELAEDPERIAAVAAELESMLRGGLVVVSPAWVHRYRHATECVQPGPQPASGGPSGRPDQVTREEVSRPMTTGNEAKRVTVYVGSSDTWHGRNLAIAIVERCRAMGMAGATVSRGVMGFGKHSVIHKAHLLGLSADLPEKVEVVDGPEAIARLLPVLDEMVGGGLIVIEDVRIVRHGETGTSD